MKDREFRSSVLQNFGAGLSIVSELLEYTENIFDHSEGGSVLGDEIFVEAWERYERESRRVGTYSCLQDRLIQLQFPVEKGISSEAAYIAATRQGRRPSRRLGLELKDPDGVRVEIHATAAGRIPLIVVSNRSDFVRLVCALARKNEPCKIPVSMGACLVVGFNNWDRVDQHRTEWESHQPAQSWNREFRRFAAQKHLYQDCFIILSNGPYSGVTAEQMGLSDDAWRATSLAIRREHESAHYYTRRVFGSTQNNMFDEIIADYMGIIEAAGRFRSDWFLRFMGLELHPEYRSGGRFENYVGDLSRPAVEVLAKLVVRASENLERHSPCFNDRPASISEKARLLGRLASMTLEEMACGDI